MFSRSEVTPGAPESSGDRNVGIAMCRVLIRRQRCRGSGQTDGAGSSDMGVAHLGERSVFGSMLALGRTS